MKLCKKSKKGKQKEYQTRKEPRRKDLKPLYFSVD